MRWLVSRARSEWVRVLGLRRRAERGERLAEELQFHIDMATERHLRSGLPPEEARRAALIAIGGRERFVEAARDEYRSRLLEEVGRDIRHSMRALRRTPSFTAAAVLTLALGIGATTAIYSVVDHVVLRPLSYEEPDRLFVVREVAQELSGVYPTVPANAGHFLEWRRRCDLCEDVAALRPTGFTMTSLGEPARLGAVRVSAGLFPLLGVRPAIGRLFSEAEDQEGGDDVVVLSHAFWQRQFGGEVSIVGRALTLDGRPRVVIGVLPFDFRLPKGSELGELISLPAEPELFVPLAATAQEINGRGMFDFAVVARLKPGITEAQAQAHFDYLQAGISERHPLTLRAAVVPLYEQLVGASGRALLLLLGAVGAVLLIVCVNLSALMLARNASRVRESAVRAALGAGRGRLVRQALTESLVLALLGGVVGIVLSYWGLQALLAAAPPDLPRLAEVRLDSRVLGVALVATGAAGLTFGVFPALRFGSADPGGTLRAGGRTITEGRRGLRARAALIASQAGLSAILLIGAGLFLASFVRVLHVDRGFQAERVLALDVVLSQAAYGTRAEQAQFYERALERLGALPGVRAAAVTNMLPLEGESNVNSLSAEGDRRPAEERPLANLRFVSPAYFAALGIPMRAGRAFAQSDRGQEVVVLSERAAAALWPGENPIGKRVVAGDNAPLAQVVGVAADVPTTSLEEPGSLIAYLPHWKGWLGSASILLRTSGDPGALAAPARADLRRVDGGVAISKVRTMAEVVSAAVARRRFELALLGLFAATALLTACIGVYGVVAHSLAGRRSEIGIRMALGARHLSIQWLVVRVALRAALLGIGAGLAVSLALGRIFGSLLFEVRPNDPTTIGLVVGLLSFCVAVACYIPARRATAGDVTAALRLD